MKREEGGKNDGTKKMKKKKSQLSLVSYIANLGARHAEA